MKITPPRRMHDERCGPARIRWWRLKEKEATVTSTIKLPPVTTDDETWKNATRAIVEVAPSELGTTKPGRPSIDRRAWLRTDEVKMKLREKKRLYEAGHTFAYWYNRYGPVIRDSNMPDSKKRDLILMKLNEDAHRKYADDVPPIQPHEIDFETKVATLQKLFASKKTLIRRRYECLRIICPPLTASDLPFRDYASKIKRMDEDALLKELDYTALKTLQFVAGLQDPSLREVRLRMLRRLDTEDTELTIEDLVVECHCTEDGQRGHGRKSRNTCCAEEESQVLQLWRTQYRSTCFLSPPTLDRRCDRNQEYVPIVARGASARMLLSSPLRTLEPTSISL